MKRLATIALLLLGLAAPAATEAALPDLGEPPYKCGEGCHAYDTADPNDMSGTTVGEVDISPHVVRVGETMTITLSWYHPGTGFAPDWRPTSFAVPGTPVGDCSPPPADASSWSYTFTATTITNQWVRHEVFFCCFNAHEEDYYAVIGEGRVISGNVMDRDPVQPTRLVPSVRTPVGATIDGKVYSGYTNSDGNYDILVEEGSGSVRTGKRHCVKAQLPKCVTSKAVTVPPSEIVNFEAPSRYKVKGVVTRAPKGGEIGPQPVNGVTIRAIDAADGTTLASATSGTSGVYDLEVFQQNVRLVSDDHHVCTTPTGECARTADLSLNVSEATTQDWTRRGGLREITVQARDPGGKGVGGVAFTVEGKESRTGKTDTSGNVVFKDLELGEYRVFATTPEATPKASSACGVLAAVQGKHGAGCSITFEDNGKATVEFSLKCTFDPAQLPTGQPLDALGGAPPSDAVHPRVSFGALEAVGCFKREGGDTGPYSTDKPFRMNGIDVYPLSGVVVNLDPDTMSVVSTSKDGSTGLLNHSVNMWMGRTPLWVGPLVLNFTNPLNINLPIDKTLVGLPPFTLKGMPITLTVNLASAGGSSTLTLATALSPTGNWKAGRFSTTSLLDVTGSVGIVGTNTAGSAIDKFSFGIEGRNGKAAIAIGDPAKPVIGITKVLVGYQRSATEGVAGLLTLAGEAQFNSKPILKGVKLALGAKVSFVEEDRIIQAYDNTPLHLDSPKLGNLVELSVDLKSANQGPIGPLFFWQDGGFTAKADVTKVDVPYSLEGRVGFSWLPGLDAGQVKVGDSKLSLDSFLGTLPSGDVGAAASAALGAVGKIVGVPGFENVKRIVDIQGKVTGTIYSDAKPWLLVINGTVTLLKGHPLLEATIADATVRWQNATADIAGRLGLTLPGGLADASARVEGFFEWGNMYVAGSGTGSVLGVRGGAEVASSVRGYIVCLRGAVPGLGGATIGVGFDFFTGEILRFSGVCDVSTFKVGSPTTVIGSAAGVRPVAVARGQKLAIFRVRGAARAPRVLLHGPGGTTISADRPGRRGRAVVFQDSGQKTTYVAIGRPRPGRWSATGLRGDRITGLAVAAERTRPTGVAALRRSGTHCGSSLAYTLRNLHGRGAEVRITGPDDARVLAQTTKARGTAALPKGLSAGRYAIEAILLDNGVPSPESLALGAFTIGSRGAVGAPTSVTARGSTLRWKAACGAQRYEVTSGKRTFAVQGTSVDLGAAARKARVVAVGPGGVRSTAVSARS